MHNAQQSGSLHPSNVPRDAEETFFIALAQLGGKRTAYAESFSATDGSELLAAAKALADAALNYVNTASDPDGRMTQQVLGSATRGLLASFLVARTAVLPTNDERWYPNIFRTVDLGNQLGNVAALAKVMGAIDPELETELRVFLNPNHTPDTKL